MAKIIEAQRINSCDQCEIDCYYRNNDSDCGIPVDCPLKDAPEWLDKPDSAGWWWFRFRDFKPLIYLLFKDEDGTGYWFVNEIQEECYCDDFKEGCKWYPATVPPLPEE